MRCVGVPSASNGSPGNKGEVGSSTRVTSGEQTCSPRRPDTAERPSCTAFPPNTDQPSHWATTCVAPGSSTTCQWPGSTSRGWTPSTTLSAAVRPRAAASMPRTAGALDCAQPVESAPLASRLAPA